MTPAALVIFVATSCADPAMSIDCQTKVQQIARQYTCEWERVASLNLAAKRGRYAVAECRQPVEGVAKK